MSSVKAPVVEKPSHPKRPCGCLVFLLILAVFLATLAIFVMSYVSSGFSSRAETELKMQIAAARDEGLAVTMRDLQKKYPGSETGSAACRKATAVLAQIDPGIWRYRNASGFETTATVPFDMRAAGIGRMFPSKDDAITTSGLYAFYERNVRAVEDILEFSRSIDTQDICWSHDFSRLRPIEELDRRYQKHGGDYRFLEDATGSLLPTAIFVALQDGDTSRAYETLFAWKKINRALNAQATHCVYGGLDDLCLPIAAELMRVAPPDLSTTHKLYDVFDPEITRRDFLRAQEAACVYSCQTIAYVLGESSQSASPGSRSPDEWRKHLFDEDAVRRRIRNIVALRQFAIPSSNEIKASVPSLRRAVLQATRPVEVEMVRLQSRILSARNEMELEEGFTKLEKWNRGLPDIASPVSFPSYTKATTDEVVFDMDRVALLRSALVLRVAELQSSGTVTALPQTLKEASDRAGLPEPFGLLADISGTSIVYTPDRATNTYQLEHRPAKLPYLQAPRLKICGSWSANKQQTP